MSYSWSNIHVKYDSHISITESLKGKTAPCLSNVQKWYREEMEKI